MIRNDMEALLEKYIIQRLRKDVWSYHSRVKMSYDLHSCTDEQKRYEKMCVSFAEIANMSATNVESCNFILNWIDKVRKDIPKAIQCGSNEPTVVTGQGSCSHSGGISMNDIETICDPVAMCRKGSLPC